MKKNKLFLSLFTAALLSSGAAGAQTRYSYTPIGGVQMAGFGGDGGHASNALFGGINNVTKDNAGNIYLSDPYNYRIRKVDAATGIVTTIAGTGIGGSSGDGGPATSANISCLYSSMCGDGSNIYFYSPGTIRKIDLATGIITTIAGNGSSNNTGDGGPALNAGVYDIRTMAAGNNILYLSSLSGHVVRKIDLSTGIIDLAAGGGIPGYTGDGGPAVNALIGDVYGVAADASGNLFMSDDAHHVIRKVDAGTGIITTICGTGQSGPAIDGIPATAAQLNTPAGMDVDNAGNLFIADMNNGKIRKIDAVSGIITTVAGMGVNMGSYSQGIPAPGARLEPRYLCLDHLNNIFLAENFPVVRKMTVESPDVNMASDSFSVQVYHQCNSTQFLTTIQRNDVSPYTVKTYYGNGQNNVHPFTQIQSGEGSSVSNYNYPVSGAYPVKHVLYNGATAIDSIQYSFQFSLCRSVAANLFLDGNSDCAFDPNTEASLSQAATIAIDSNNVAIDTISVTGRFIYNALGNVGDIYTFTVVDLPLGLQTSCMNGVFTDTIQWGGYTSSREIATQCGTVGGFDLSVNAFFAGTANYAEANIVVQNTYCNAQAATLTMTYSPKYEYQSAVPPPTSQNGNELTWLLAPGDFANYIANLQVSFTEANMQIVMPGDTVHTSFSVTPTTGDINAANNVVNRIDTVTGPYDPNAVYVSPEGCIMPGASLLYTVTFENTGNDTAHSIYVMDTLNNNVDMASIEIVATSHPMNFTKTSSGAYNILRFEFPNIDLPDSSHHDLCNGMVIYKINSRSNMGLSDVVTNKAGIYFDYMPVVLTNVAESPVCQPQSVNTVNANSKLVIFPNPGHDQVTITGDASIISCNVLDQSGRVLLRKDLVNGKAQLDLRQLSAGMYFIQATGEGATETRKFVKL